MVHFISSDMFSILIAIKDERSIDDERTFDPLPVLSPLPSSCTHQIFTSFCGVDVRKSFLSHMLVVFRNKGITPFTDNEINSDMSIVLELNEAIKRSRISIVLISYKYASSTCCLDELVLIMKCRKELSQTVIPIFYEVEPSDVKRQSGYFGSVFEKICVGRSVEDAEKWRQALYEVALIPGYDTRIWLVIYIYIVIILACHCIYVVTFL